MSPWKLVGLGALVIALIGAAFSGLRYEYDLVPTYEWPVSMFYVDPDRVDETIDQIKGLDGVQSTRLFKARGELDPTLFGVVRYDGFVLMLLSYDEVDEFNTYVRPWRRRIAPEPDPAEVEAAMEQLQAIMPSHLGQRPIFIQDESPQPAAERRRNHLATAG